MADAVVAGSFHAVGIVPGALDDAGAGQGSGVFRTYPVLGRMR